MANPSTTIDMTLAPDLKTPPRRATMYRSQKMAWVRPSVQSSAPCPLPKSSCESRKLTNTMAVTQPGLRTSATPTISRNM